VPKSLTALIGLFTAFIAGCAGTGLPPLRGVEEPVDLPRFMGDWYVIAHIPIHLPPLATEAEAFNGVESYRLNPDGTIATTYRFLDGGFDGKETVMEPRATVANAPVNSEWKMKFFWFLPAGDYLVLSVDPDYQRTIIGVPDRRWVWIMARTPTLPAAEYAAMVAELEAMGYDTTKLRVVPQKWPAGAGPQASRSL
jgi:apolipoprotein D and lipocalin family protein